MKGLEEKAFMFSFQTQRARIVLKPYEEDKDVLTLKQVHSSKVFLLEDLVESLEGDGIITQKKGLKIGVKTADCVPVAFLGKETVAVIHAGWRGIKEGIVEKTLQMLSSLEGLEDFFAFVGPSAKACCYEVGEEFREHFVSLHLRNQKTYMDTQGEVILRLKKYGIKRLFQYGVCTVCHHSLPSYRRDKTQKRMLTFAEIIA